VVVLLVVGWSLLHFRRNWVVEIGYSNTPNTKALQESILCATKNLAEAFLLMVAVVNSLSSSGGVCWWWGGHSCTSEGSRWWK
jgi:hypothetical protein